MVSIGASRPTRIELRAIQGAIIAAAHNTITSRRAASDAAARGAYHQRQAASTGRKAEGTERAVEARPMSRPPHDGQGEAGPLERGRHARHPDHEHGKEEVLGQRPARQLDRGGVERVGHARPKRRARPTTERPRLATATAVAAPIRHCSRRSGAR